MRTVIAGVAALLLIACSQPAAALEEQFSTPERLMQWTFTYRSHPDLDHVPAAVRAMRELGLLRDEEKTGFFIGFIAGVIGANPGKAEWLVGKILPMPPKEQGVVVKAIAYSGLPDWPVLLTRFGKRMPERKLLIDDFLSGREPTLLKADWDQGPTLLYTMWGYYVGTGYYAPVRRIIEALRWSASKDEEEESGWSWGSILSSVGWSREEVDLDKLSIGSTAKWTLVSYAEHHRDLLDLYRVEILYQPPEVARPLKEVLAAAEAFEAERVRKEENTLMEEAKRKALVSGVSPSRGAYAGSVGIATACVIAGATGHPEIAIPCVVTGALYSGAMKLMTGP